MKLSQRFTAFCLTLLLMLSVCPLSARAATVASGTCGDNVTWTLDDADTLTISGEGPMWDYTYDPMSGPVTPWMYNGTILSIIVEDGVTTIGNYSFHSLWDVTSVSIPYGINSIGEHAFVGTGMPQINIPDCVTFLGADAFASTGLVSVTVPGSITHISDRAFHGCDFLETVEILEGVETIGAEAFAGNEKA